MSPLRISDNQPVDPASEAVRGSPRLEFADRRTLTTSEANAFLNRAPGFLEKRRCSGIDSPRYIQTRRYGAVRYRVEDLLAWEAAKMRENTDYEM